MFNFVCWQRKRRSYLKLLKGVPCDWCLKTRLERMGHVMHFETLSNMFQEHGLELSYGRWFGKDVVLVKSGKTCVAHEITGSDMVKQVSDRFYKWSDRPNGFVQLNTVNFFL